MSSLQLQLEGLAFGEEDRHVGRPSVVSNLLWFSEAGGLGLLRRTRKGHTVRTMHVQAVLQQDVSWFGEESNLARSIEGDIDVVFVGVGDKASWRVESQGSSVESLLARGRSNTGVGHE